jgi:hypothetical protein
LSELALKLKKTITKKMRRLMKACLKTAGGTERRVSAGFSFFALEVAVDEVLQIGIEAVGR